jgi:hypothetical protein
MGGIYSSFIFKTGMCGSFTLQIFLGLERCNVEPAAEEAVATLELYIDNITLRVLQTVVRGRCA